MRNADHWLTPEALRTGLREESALYLDENKHVILLEWAGLGTPLQWRVTHTLVTPEGVMVETHNWWYERLKTARWRWQEEVTRIHV